MAQQYVITETNLVYEDDYIIFSMATEDPWMIGRFNYEIAMYKPMYTANGHMIYHPFAYENGQAKQYFRRKQFGFTSFENATDKAKHVVGMIVHSINEHGMDDWRATNE